MNDKNRPESARMALAEIFAPRSAAQLRHRKDDLLHRAGLVTEFGWDRFRHQWSTGEVLATALVLNDKAEIGDGPKPWTQRCRGGHSISGDSWTVRQTSTQDCPRPVRGSTLFALSYRSTSPSIGTGSEISMVIHQVRDGLITSGQFPELLNAEQVSGLLGVSAATLNRWAAIREQTGQQIGPPCYSLSDRVRRWDAAEVRKWLRQVRR